MEAATLTRAETQIAGLRALAEAIEADPDAFVDVYIRASGIISGEEDQKARLARIAKAIPGRVEKHVGDDLLTLSARLGGHPGVAIDFYADREAVCERIVTGKRTVERVEIEELAPATIRKRTVEVEEDVVEWRCEPLLGEAPDA